MKIKKQMDNPYKEFILLNTNCINNFIIEK